MAGLKEDGTIVTCTNGYNHCTPDIRLFDGILSFEKILQQRIQEEWECKRKKLTDQLAAAKQRKLAEWAKHQIDITYVRLADEYKDCVFQNLK